MAADSLARSYSEHAALVLRHYGSRQRRRIEPARCTRSGPDCRRPGPQDEADDEDDDEEDENDGRRTWRISASTSKESRPFQHCREIIEIGAGDSGALSAGFSELNLRSSSPSECEALEAIYQPGEDRVESDVPFSFDENLQLLDDEEFPEEHNSSSCSLASGDRPQRISGQPLKRLISYEDWAREKRLEVERRKEEARRAAEASRARAEQEDRERAEKERRDCERYAAWLRAKQREKLLGRRLMEKELELQRRIREAEERASRAKAACLEQWHRKKAELIKATEREEMERKEKTDREKQRRLQESLKAYEKWREKAKNTPRPATQGLLPHQKAKPAFTNPTPWQPLVDDASDDSDGGNQTKTPNPPGKSKKISVKR